MDTYVVVALDGGGPIHLSFQPCIFELEFLLDALTPSALVVKVHVSAKFILGCGMLWLLMALEPGEILLVVAPR